MKKCDVIHHFDNSRGEGRRRWRRRRERCQFGESRVEIVMRGSTIPSFVERRREIKGKYNKRERRHRRGR